MTIALAPSYEELVEMRRASGVPMYNDNKMKLGIFGSNCSHGPMATHAESTYELTGAVAKLGQ